MKILYRTVGSCLDCPSYRVKTAMVQNIGIRHIEKCEIMEFECSWIYPEHLAMSRKMAFNRCKLPHDEDII